MSLDVSVSVSVGNMVEKAIIKQEEIDEIIKEHGKWLEDNTKGKRADLRKTRLDGLDMHGADLSFADFSGASLGGVNLRDAKLTGACFRQCDFGSKTDLKNADLDEADLFQAKAFHSNFARCSMKLVNMQWAVMWDSCFKCADLTGANMYDADLSDCIFRRANLSHAYMYFSNLDGATLSNANLKNAVIKYAKGMVYADLSGADFTRADISECVFRDEGAAKAKVLQRYMLCPEEGSFIAWYKCRDDLIVKLMIPENALRTGGVRADLRASEANVLEITDANGEHKESAVCIDDESIVFKVGETVKVPEEKFDPSLWHDGDGIHFFLTKGEAEEFRNEVEEDEDDEDTPTNP